MTTQNSAMDSVSVVISQLKNGKRTQVDFLLQRYLKRLVGLAASRLQSKPDLKDYAEDIAISTLKSVCLRVERGRLEELRDRDELWRLMATITIRKTISFLRSHKRAGQATDFHWANLFGSAPDPCQALVMKSQVEGLLSILDDEEMQAIAKWKVEGFSNGEIAKRLGCVERTVERRLHRIRAIWQKELGPSC